MTVARIERGERTANAFEVRTIRAADLFAALREGWGDFLERRGDLIFVSILYPVIGLVAATVSLNGSLIPLFFPLAMGVALMGPAAAVGFYELARRREHGLNADWSHFFDATRRPAFDAIATVTGVLIMIFLFWVIVAGALHSTLMGTAPESVGEFLSRLFTTPAGWALIVIGNLIGMVFAAGVLAVGVVSMPMLVDKDVDARTAIETSLRAVAANKRVMLGWGAIVAALLVAGSIPFFIGLAVVLPVLGYATWHLYTRLVVR